MFYKIAWILFILIIVVLLSISIVSVFLADKYRRSINQIRDKQEQLQREFDDDWERRGGRIK
jgi:CHASE3 domain sensor protein